MNAISILMQPTLINTTVINSRNTETAPTKEGIQHFQQLLGESNHSLKIEQITDHRLEKMRNKLSGLEKGSLENLLANLINKEEQTAEDVILLEEMIGKLDLLSQMDENTGPIIEGISDQLVRKIMEVWKQNMTGPNSNEISLAIPPILFESRSAESDNGKMGEQAKGIFLQAESLLSKIETPQQLKQVAPELLKLLEQWTRFVGKSGIQTDFTSSSKAENNSLAGVWKDLVQAFQNRMGMDHRQHYNLDAKVTTNDVIRWLGKALEAKVQTEKTTIQPQVTNTMAPISKVEQFVIHLNQTQQNAPADKQLVDQVQKIMDANRVTNLQQGRGQLSIILKPANLGEMLVRFTQMNGETVVKILVTTGVAKEMLEGNLQQLRNIFAPQQVVIEKQESIVQQSPESQKEQANSEEHRQREDERHADDSAKHSEEESFANLFEELMLNEKV